MVRCHGESFIKRLCFSIQMCKWLNVQQLTTRAQWDVTILWSPNVDQCRFSNVDWDKRKFHSRGPREWSVQADNIKNTKEINSLERIIFNNMFLTK